MVIERKTGVPKVRTLNHLATISNGLKFGVHNNDVATVIRGLVTRVFCRRTPEGLVDPPEPPKGIFYRRLRKFFNKLVRGMGTLTEWSYERFLSTYTGQKRSIYEAAVESLKHYGIRLKDSFLSTFTKAEKVNLTSNPDPDPRVIQPRTPRFNAAIGVFLKPLEGLIYKRIGKVFGYPVVAKGKNADERGKMFKAHYDAIPDCSMIGLDASRFDQHVSVQALEWTHSVYTYLYRGNPKGSELSRLLQMRLENRGFARCRDGTVKYRVHGRRTSGDMDTAFGNVLLMCAMVYAFMDELGYKSESYRFVNDGDDCVLLVPRSAERLILERLPSWFLEMGFVMKVEKPVYVLEEVEFCQARPVFTGDHYRMVRDPRVTLSKDAVSLRPIPNEKAWNRLRRSIALCGASLAGDMPVLGAWYRALQRGAEDARPTVLDQSGFVRLASRMEAKCSEPTDACRVSFWKAFGITPQRQVSCELALDEVVPSFESIPYVTHCGYLPQ